MDIGPCQSRPRSITTLGWLVSLLVHIALLGMLAAVRAGLGAGPRQDLAEVTIVLKDIPEPGERPAVFRGPEQAPLEPPGEAAKALLPQELSDVTAPGPRPGTPDAPIPIVVPREALMTLPPLSMTEPLPFDIGGFATRRGIHKAIALRARGGSPATERAVNLALDWLQRRQRPDGAWDGRHPSYRVACTGLALLCFLGAGHSQTSPSYGRTVEQAVAWLRRAQSADGTFPGTNNYGLAIGTMALAEAFAMDRHPEVGKAAAAGVEAIVRRQCPAGGWDYAQPGPRNDMSVSGWAVMALKSAAVAGLTGTEPALRRFDKLLHDTLGQRDGSWYAVIDPDGRVGALRTGEAMHAVSLLCRLLLGQKGTRVLLKGAATVSKDLPDWPTRHTYHVYYASLALCQIGGPSWERWNRHVSDLLVKHQHTDADRAGSWDPGQGIGEDAGPVYITSLCCLTLEVYYRYAAIYR